MTKPLVITAVAAMLLLPAAALAAIPSASTGGARDITQTTATLRGSVNPNGEATTFYFQYGTTKQYGSQTPTQGPTGAVKTSQPVSAGVDSLAPNTTYHYRLVAVNASGTKFGGDKTFRTVRPPPSITLFATRGSIVAGRSVELNGVLTPSPGKTAAGVKITLQAGGKAVATTKTDAAGRYSFTQSPRSNTIYTAVAATSPRATSQVRVVGVALRITLQLSTAHPKRGKRVIFSGTVDPARVGGLARVQKRVGGHWRTVKSGVIQLGPAAGQSAYRIAVGVRRRGTYRVFVAGDAANLAGTSRKRLISPR